MNKLSNEELHNINGGGIKLSIGAYMIIGGAKIIHNRFV